MEELIRAIAEHIENWTIDYLNSSPDTNVKNWGFVELAFRESKSQKSAKRDSSSGVSTQPIPMTINGTGQRQQVSLDDRYDFIFWIRWVSPIQNVPDDSESWGLRVGRRMNMPLRILIAHKVTKGEDLIVNLVNELPSTIYLTGFESIFLNQQESIDPDHETIYRTELGNTVYELHRFDWNLYVINLTVDFLPCVDFTMPEFITDEFGNCLFV